MGEHPRIVWVSMLYMDTQVQGVSHGCTSSDCPEYSGYGQSWVDIFGWSGIVWVSLVYTDTQTQGVSHGCTSLDFLGYSGYGQSWVDIFGWSRIVLGVQGYLDKGRQSYGWTSSDSPG